MLDKEEVARGIAELQKGAADLRRGGWTRRVPTGVGIALTKVEEGLAEAQAELEPTFSELLAEAKAEEENN